MIENGHDTKVKENPLNDNFFKQEFQDLWKRINKRYAYTVEFDSPELIEKSIGVLNANLNVSTLRYNLVKGEQMDDNEFVVRETASPELVHTTTSSVEYDLIGKIADQATLTRKSVVHILKGINPQKRAMFGQNPEEFIQHVVAEINKQKASIIVEHISYRPSAEEPYTQNIFNMSKSSQEYAKAYHAKKPYRTMFSRTAQRRKA